MGEGYVPVRTIYGNTGWPWELRHTFVSAFSFRRWIKVAMESPICEGCTCSPSIWFLWVLYYFDQVFRGYYYRWQQVFSWTGVQVRMTKHKKCPNLVYCRRNFDQIWSSIALMTDDKMPKCSWSQMTGDWTLGRNSTSLYTISGWGCYQQVYKQYVLAQSLSNPIVIPTTRAQQNLWDLSSLIFPYANEML